MCTTRSLLTVSALLGFIPVFVAWLYTEYIQYSKNSLPSKAHSDVNLAVLDKLSEKDVVSASLIEEGHQASIKTTYASSSAFSLLFRDQVNFVMLNVDNTKWEYELDEFGVERIPHFAFLDKEWNEEGNEVGKLPKQLFLENVAALANGESTMLHSRVVGQFSSAEQRKVHQVTDPRNHG